MPRTSASGFTKHWFGLGRHGDLKSTRQEAADTVAWYLMSKMAQVAAGVATVEGIAEVTNAVITMGRGPLLIIQILKFVEEHMRAFR